MTPDEKIAKSWVVNRMIDRIEITYADYIVDIKGYNKLPDFFRNHLYSPNNKAERDTALDSLYQKLKSVTGPEMTENIHKLIILNKVTDELDLQIAQVLLKTRWKNGLPEENDLTIEILNQTILEAGDFEKREKQIDLIGETLAFFYSLSTLPLIRLVMAPIKVAASMVGASALIATMEAGYLLSKGIKDMKPFVKTFNEREKEFLKTMVQ